MSQITLRSATYTPIRPRSQAQILAVIQLAETGQITPAVAGASLGLTMPREVAKTLGCAAVQWSGRAWQYGEAVYDALVTAGVGHVDVIRAGVDAYRAVEEALVTEGEVKAAEGFTEPPVGAPPWTGI